MEKQRLISMMAFYILVGMASPALGSKPCYDAFLEISKIETQIMRPSLTESTDASQLLITLGQIRERIDTFSFECDSPTEVEAALRAVDRKLTKKLVVAFSQRSSRLRASLSSAEINEVINFTEIPREGTVNLSHADVPLNSDSFLSFYYELAPRGSHGLAVYKFTKAPFKSPSERFNDFISQLQSAQQNTVFKLAQKGLPIFPILIEAMEEKSHLGFLLNFMMDLGRFETHIPWLTEAPRLKHLLALSNSEAKRLHEILRDHPRFLDTIYLFGIERDLAQILRHKDPLKAMCSFALAI